MFADDNRGFVCILLMGIGCCWGPSLFVLALFDGSCTQAIVRFVLARPIKASFM